MYIKYISETLSFIGIKITHADRKQTVWTNLAAFFVKPLLSYSVSSLVCLSPPCASIV